jgi:hypothetical protein
LKLLQNLLSYDAYFLAAASTATGFFSDLLATLRVRAALTFWRRASAWSLDRVRFVKSCNKQEIERIELCLY